MLHEDVYLPSVFLFRVLGPICCSFFRSLGVFFQRCEAFAPRLGDEEINDALGGAAHCEEPSIVGILTSDVLEERTSVMRSTSWDQQDDDLLEILISWKTTQKRKSHQKTSSIWLPFFFPPRKNQQKPTIPTKTPTKTRKKPRKPRPFTFFYSLAKNTTFFGPPQPKRPRRPPSRTVSTGTRASPRRFATPRRCNGPSCRWELVEFGVV